MKIKAIFVSLGLALMSLFTIGGIQVVTQTAAHATVSESWNDWTYGQSVNDQSRAGIYANSHQLAVDNYPSLDTIGVIYQSAGYWCLWDETSDNGFYIGIGAFNQLVDNYSGSCNVGGDKWVITCYGGAGNQGLFYLQNLHNNDYVTIPSGSLVLHATATSTNTAHVLADLSKTECQY